MDNQVVISEIGKDVEIEYPRIPPFNPREIYPELKELKIPLETDETNHIYEIVRNCLVLGKLDEANIDSEDWNPLAEIITPGESVIIKPNFVLNFNASGQSEESVITHGSILRPIIDYVLLALKGKGKIIIADAPQMNCDFDDLIDKNGIKMVVEYYKGVLASSNQDVTIELMDLRRERTIYKGGVVWERIPLNQDPLGYAIIDLKQDSEVKDIDTLKLYGADYNRDETIEAHSNGSHKYFVSKTILSADTVISVPKLKVHRKAGVTLNLKNLVGINGNKNYLIHYRVESPENGGDEFSKVTQITKIDRILKDRLLKKNWNKGKYLFRGWLFVKAMLNRLSKSKEVFAGGDWHGNDTVWRMVLDLNKIILYADECGNMKQLKQRKCISFIDGIIGGEKEGPLATTPVKSGVVLFGANMIAVDLVATSFMGLDYKKIPLYNNAFKVEKYKLFDLKGKDIKVISKDDKYNNLLEDKNIVPYSYIPSRGWIGYIER